MVVAFSVWAVLTGFRKGFFRQTGSFLALAFAIVAARLLSPELIATVDGWIPQFYNGFNRIFICRTAACGVIYFITYAIVSFCGIPLGKVVGMLGSGMLDSIAGAVLKLFITLMAISIVYNFIVDLQPASQLTRSSSQHDGNLLEGVMKIAPPFLGFTGAEEVAYLQQMEEAKKIS